MKDGTEYELLTQRIYQLLLNKDGYNTVEVKHDVKVKGKSNVKHQIDVFWEFKMADVVHRVAIECKDYNSKISLGRIRDFHSALQDIGNIYGIMVTKVGYQSGVQDYAKHHGVGLKLLRNPIEEDWDGRLKKIVINIKMVVPQIRKRNIIVDEKWVKENIPQEKWTTRFEISGMADEVWIMDKDGNKIKNFHQLERGVPQNWKDELGLIHTYEFEDNYMEVKPYGLIKIKSISFEYDVLSGEGTEVVIDAEEVVDKVLKDLLSDDIKFIYKDGRIN
jgi:hypothetical protein